MDSFELNKILGAFLGAVFVVFTVGIVSDALFHAEAPEQEGYAIAALEPEAGAGEAAEEAGPEPIGPLIASADPAAGQSAFRRCAACHTTENGGANRIGPNLWDIINRPVASHEGFGYSNAMTQFAEGGSVVWDYDHLSEFLLAPKGLVPGTAMNFPGIRDAGERANMIAYLRTLADDPAPLPEAAAEPAAAEGEAEEAAPAEEEAAPAEGEATPAEQGEEAPAEPQEGTTAPAPPQDRTDEPSPADSVSPTPDAGNEPDAAGEAETAPADEPADAPAADETPAEDEPAEGAQ